MRFFTENGCEYQVNTDSKKIICKKNKILNWKHYASLDLKVGYPAVIVWSAELLSLTQEPTPATMTERVIKIEQL